MKTSIKERIFIYVVYSNTLPKVKSDTYTPSYLSKVVFNITLQLLIVVKFVFIFQS